MRSKNFSLVGEPGGRLEPTLLLTVDEGLELSRLARGFLVSNLRALGFG